MEGCFTQRTQEEYEILKFTMNFGRFHVCTTGQKLIDQLAYTFKKCSNYWRLWLNSFTRQGKELHVSRGDDPLGEPLLGMLTSILAGGVFSLEVQSARKPHAHACVLTLHYLRIFS